MSGVEKFFTAQNPDHVLEQAIGHYADVVVIGWSPDGTLDVRSNKGMTGPDVLWLIEAFKAKLVAGHYGD